MNRLQALFARCKTDKLSLRYDAAYEFLCGHLLKLANPRVLEIGVLNGASIRAWREWFGTRAYIATIEINPTRAANVSGQCHVFVGDQSDKTFLNGVIRDTTGRFDLVVDDASHIPSDQLASFEVLWPHVNPWGVYVIEDVGSNIGNSRRRHSRKHPGSMPIDAMFLKAISNMRNSARRPPEEFICYCGMALFIIKVPESR
jgi:predicted O-methyltransferase YrrM